MFDELASIIAAFNDGANRGFWRIQLRDKIGQWAEMGRGLLSKVRMPDGSIQDQRGVYIGASERAGYGRQLVLEDDGKYYIYDIRPSNLEQFDATIPDEVLKEQGITKKARTPSRAEMSDPEIQDLADMNRRPATEADIKLATDVPDEGQKAIIKAEREKSPLAKLPAGAEGKMSDEELAKLIESPSNEESTETPAAPKAEEPKARKFVKASRKAVEEAETGAEFFYSRGGKLHQLHVRDDGYLYRGPYIEWEQDSEGKIFGSYDDIAEANATGRGPGNLYKGRLPRDENNNPLGSIQFSNLLSEQMAAAKAVKKAVEKIDKGEKVDLDEVITEKLKAPSVGSDDDISFFDDEEDDVPPTPAPTPEPEAVPAPELEPTPAAPSVGGTFDTAGMDAKTIGRLNAAIDKKINYEGEITTLRKLMETKGQGKTAFDKVTYGDNDPETGRITGQRYGFYTGEGTSFLEIPKIAYDSYVPNNGRVDDNRESSKQASKDVTPEPVVEKIEPTKTEPEPTTEAPEAPADEIVAPAKTPKTPNRVVDKIDPAELEKLGTPESYTEYFGFTPSEEQTLFLNSIVKAKKSTAVRAGAGAGKTTTYIGTTKALQDQDPSARVVLVQFNRINADEAAAVVPKNTNSNTTDAYFGRPYLASIGQSMADRYLSQQRYHITSNKQLADHFQFEDVYVNGENATPPEVAGLVKTAVSNFSYSIDDKIGPQHFDLSGFGNTEAEVKPESMDKLLSYANKYWDDLKALPGDFVTFKKKDGTTGKKRVTGVTRIQPEHAVKMWAMSKPDLSKLRSSDGKPITHLFLDEAQDTNAVLEKVINDNIDAGTAPLIAMVGDRSQNIYAFRGTSDALSTFAEGRAESVVTLTVTRRFGENIVGPANGFLNLIGEDYRLKSEIEGGEILETRDLDEIPGAYGNTTVLTRTNGAAFAEMTAFLAEDKVVGVSQVLKNDLDNAVGHLEWLLSDFNTRPKQPPIVSEDFIGMKSRKDLQLAAKIDPQSKAAYWERLLSFSGNADEAVKELKKLSESVVVEREQVDAGSVTNLDASTGKSGVFKNIGWSIEGDSIVLQDTVKNAIFQKPLGSTKSFRELVIGSKKENIEPTVMLPDGTAPQWRAKKKGSDWVSELLVPSDADRTAYLNKIASLFEAETKEPPKIDVRVSTAHRYKGKQDENIIIGEDFPKPGVAENGEATMPNEGELNLAYVAVTRPTKRIFLGSLAWGREYEGKDGLAKANQALERDSDFGMDLWDREEAAQQKIRDKRASKADTSLKMASSTSYNGEVYFSDDENEVPDVAGSQMQAKKTPKKFVDDWGVNQKGFSKRIDGTTWNAVENKDGTITVRPRTNEDRVSARKYNNWAEAEKDFPKFQKDAKSANTEKLVETVSAFDKDGEIAKVIRDGGDSEDILKAITGSEDYVDAVDEGRLNFVSLYAALDNAGTSGLKPPKTRKPKDINPPKFIDSAEVNAAEYDKYPDAHDNGDDEINILDIDDKVLLNTKTRSTASEIIKKLIDFGGKIQPDGSVVMFRRNFDEQTGPAEGEQRILEARWVATKASSGVLIYKITDPKDGSSREFRVRDTFDSFGAAVNKLKKQMNTYWMRDVVANPMSKDAADNAERIRDYSGIEGSIRELRKSNFQNLLRDRKASITPMRILTAEEEAQLLLSGRDMRLAGGAEDWQKVQLKGIASVTDAIEAGEYAGAASLFQQYLLNIPDTKSAQDTAKKVLRSMVERKFPNMDKRKMEAILTDMSDKVDSSLPKTGLVVRPHVDRNGTPVTAGSIVSWNNNVEGSAVGVVDQLVSYENPNGGQLTYSDYALVRFKGKKKPVVLNTGNMTVMPEGSSEDVTAYNPWVKNQDLKIERHKIRGFTYDYDTGEFFDKGTKIDELTFPEESNLFAAKTIKKPVKDLKPGQAIYDDEGNLYGKVEKIKLGKVNGEDKLGVKLEGNNKPLFFDPEEETNIEEPKGYTGPKTEVTAGPATPEAERAKALGLHPTDGGKPAKKKISKNPNKLDPDTNTNIRGSKNKKAIKPTAEAKAIKDEVLSIGAELQKQAELKLADKLREKGIDIDPNKPFEDQIDDAAAKATNEAFASLIISENQLKDFQESKSVDVNGESYGKLYDGMVADGLATKTGINKPALAKALKDAGLEALSYEIKNEDAKKGKSSLIAYAYNLLKDENLKAEAIQAYKDLEAAEETHLNAKETSSRLNRIIKTAQAEATLETLKENGVKFDTVSYADFEGSIVTADKGYEFRPNSTFKSAVALQEAFDRMPEAAIRQLAEHLKSTGKKLFVKAGVKRGSFANRRDGNYQLELSASFGLEGINKHTDTALHELQHFLQEVDPNLRAVEHAWAYDRLLQNAGTDKETLPNIVSIPNTKGELTFAKPGISQPYMLKSYDTSGDFFLTPNSRGSEVTSVLMQDMFTSPGMASMPNGQYTVSWTMEPIKSGPNAGQLRRKYKVTRDAFYNPESDAWFEDEEMTKPIENVVSYFGRAKREGLDRDVKSLGMGLVMMMNDWSATEGFGPGNAVVVPPKDGEK